MDRWFCRAAVVTGAGSGIGYATVCKLVSYGMLVAGLDLKIDTLKNLSTKLKDFPGKLYPMKCNITKERDVIDSFKKIRKTLGPVHVLINNAGIIKDGFIYCQTADDVHKVFNVNVFGVCSCIRQAVYQMLCDRVEGHIIQINSTNGHNVQLLKPPIMNVYPATKFAITAINEVLRQEMNCCNTRIKVSSISPGLVKTNMSLNFPADQPVPDLTKPHLLPEDVAEAVVYVLSTPPEVTIHDLILKAVGEHYL